METRLNSFTLTSYADPKVSRPFCNETTIYCDIYVSHILLVNQLIQTVNLLQTNPFDLFETFFGPSMAGFPGMDQAGFRTTRRSTVTKGEDIR